MRRVLTIALVALAALPAHVHADSGALFGESARALSLANSVVGRPGDSSAIYWNPAGIADVARPVILLHGHAGDRQLDFARTGEPGFSRHRLVSGYGVSVLAALPGPEWLARVHIGGAVHIPGGNIISVVAPVRDDAPVEPYYGGRTDRTAATVALGLDLPYGLRLGAAVTVMPNLVAPTDVGFDARRGEDVDDGVIIRQDRDLTLDASMIVGARWQIIPELAFGVVWRQGGATRASGTFVIAAGAIYVIDEYRFYDLLAPEEVALGACVTPLPELSISLDLTWGRWSDYRTIHDELPAQPFSDVIDVRAGAEWLAHPALRVRLGYGFLPSPVPVQSGASNFLDAHRHELGFGLGLDLEPLARVPLRIDLGVRVHAQHEQSATKDRALLPDAAPTQPGRTIDNLGYPGFTSRGSFVQVALSFTIALDGTRPPPEDQSPEPPSEEIDEPPQSETPEDAEIAAPILDDEPLDEDNVEQSPVEDTESPMDDAVTGDES